MVHVESLEEAAEEAEAAEALVLCAGSFVDAHCPDHVDRGLAALSTTISRLEGFRLRLLRERGITDRSALSAEFGLSGGEAAQLEKMADRLPTLVSLQDAVESGDVSMSKARMVADVVNRDRAEAAERDAAKLTAMATELAPNQLARELERWGRSVDEERGVDTNEDLRAKRSLETQKRHTGMTEIIAALDPESAEVVAGALDARVQAEWRDETAGQHPERTSAQRRADALVGICRDWLNGFGAHAPQEWNAAVSIAAKSNAVPMTSRSRPQVSVIINLDDLVNRTGHGASERGAALSAEAIRRIACDAGISAIFTNSQSQIVDVGREQRTFTGAIRKVLILRDQGCRFPSCNAPPSWSDGHHIEHWATGGTTTTSNGCLLCSRHHHYVHEGGWMIVGDANSELTFTSPTGTVLRSKPPGLTTRAAA